MGTEAVEDLLEEKRKLQEQLYEAEEILRALRNGEVDAVVASSPSGDRVYTLKGADEAYRIMVQGMADGALTLALDGLILFSNEQFASLVGTPLERVIGCQIHDFIAAEDQFTLRGLLNGTNGRKAELRLRAKPGELVPAYLSLDNVFLDEVECLCLIVTDLRGQKRNEETVASERLARSILEQAAEAILVLDPEGWITRANRAAETLGGESLACRSFDEVFRIRLSSGENYTFQRILSAVGGSETVTGLEATALTRDGREINLLLSAAKLSGPDPGLLGCIVTFVDITERKKAEAAAREKDLQFRTLADSIPQLAWITDKDGAVIWFNRRWYQYTGSTAEDVEGWGWQRLQHPDHLSRVMEHYRRSIQHGDEWEDTFPLRSRDGEYRWFLSRAQPIHSLQGEIVRWFGTNTDITDRQVAEEALRESEARFRGLYEADIVGMVSADEETVFEANDLFLKMVGYSRAELERNQIPWSDMTPEEYRPLDQRGVEELAARGSCKPFEKELLRKDGSRVPILIGATRLDQSPMRWLSFILDLTERKALEKKLLEKQKLESLGLLAGGIAHDFNNLLVGILGNASLAQEVLPEETPAGDLLDGVIQASERAAHLTRQMLAYSGRGRLVIEPVDLSRSAQEITKLVQSSIPNRITLRLELNPDLPPVEADAGQMQQVIMNLVINAAEAIGESAGAVTVRTGVVAIDDQFIREQLDGIEIHPGHYVYLEVQDTGAGMDGTTRARIFDPFFTTKFTGRGLGLAAVSGIVRGHDGAIQVTSEPGMGSTFLVLFPAARRGPRPPDAAPPTQPVEDGQRATVLLVDDEQLVLNMATIALRRKGYTVLQAENGPAALEVLRRDRHGVSLVILDLSMPGMSGQEALPEIRKIVPQAEVIISSGYSESEALRVFSGQSISGFLQKPYTSSRLLQKVAAVTRRPTAGRRN
jgi:PAS domain S-box-containing protein